MTSKLSRAASVVPTKENKKTSRRRIALPLPEEEEPVEDSTTTFDMDTSAQNAALDRALADAKDDEMSRHSDDDALLVVPETPPAAEEEEKEPPCSPVAVPDPAAFEPHVSPIAAKGRRSTVPESAVTQDDDDDKENEAAVEQMFSPRPLKRSKAFGPADFQAMFSVMQARIKDLEHMVKEKPAPKKRIELLPLVPAEMVGITPQAAPAAAAAAPAKEQGFHRKVSREEAAELWQQGASEKHQKQCAVERERAVQKHEARLAELKSKKMTSSELDSALKEEQECHEQLLLKLDEDSTDGIALERFYFDQIAWMHPDTTMKLWCRRMKNNLWWEDQVLSKWEVFVRKPKYGDALYLSVKSPSRPQRFNGKELQQVAFFLPMCKIRYARVYPHGNKDVDRFTPDHPYQIQYSLEVTTHGFSDRFDSQLESDANPTNIQRAFKWVEEDMSRWMSNAMYDKDGVANDVKTKLKVSTPKDKINDGKFMREQFFDRHCKKPVCFDKNGVRHIKLSHPLLRGLRPSEREQIHRNPYTAHTQYLHDVFHKPEKVRVVPPKEGAKPKAVDPNRKVRTHYDPMILEDLPLLAARPLANAPGAGQPSAGGPINPYTLVPFNHRDLRDGDMVFPLVGPDLFNQNKDNDKTGSGGMVVYALLYAGECYSLDESLEQLSKSVDLSQAFAMAQPYQRQGVQDDRFREDMRPPQAAESKSKKRPREGDDEDADYAEEPATNEEEEA